MSRCTHSTVNRRGRSAADTALAAVRASRADHHSHQGTHRADTTTAPEHHATHMIRLHTRGAASSSTSRTSATPERHSDSSPRLKPGASSELSR